MKDSYKITNIGYDMTEFTSSVHKDYSSDAPTGVPDVMPGNTEVYGTNPGVVKVAKPLGADALIDQIDLDYDSLSSEPAPAVNDIDLDYGSLASPPEQAVNDIDLDYDNLPR